ncbi:error-prone DNA polymerase [Uliginosibacterium sp. H3]|uniref:Error-prone DNA polymerase n=1 Tax=Uliginosibacterium silvisoli TaxID=3114758 RepID=A0ABU6K8S4_9RHOO|nr:error-prone DNA polymerase [Uliginosibacterium sp. H3]
MAKLPDYAELHCLSNFSFLRGASQPGELMQQARMRGYKAVAITDECSLAGVVQAWQALKDLREEDAEEAREAERKGLPPPPAKPPLPKLIVGSEFVFSCGLKLVLLAQNREGYGNLSALITLARRRSPKGEYELQRGDLTSIVPRGAVPDCLAIWIPGTDADEQTARWLAARFPKDAHSGEDRLWIGVELLCGPDDAAQLARLQAISEASNIPLVACGDVHMHAKDRRPLQDTLTAIRLHTTVFDAGHALFPNAERHLRSRVRLGRLYPHALLEESVRIAERCNFDLGTLGYEYPGEIVPQGHTPTSYLRQETEKGLVSRYPDGTPEQVRNDVEKELTLIAEKQYEAFFLTVYDIVLFARSEGILCQGRGSAANSSVCYALGITAVDPTRAHLLFERFLSRERDEPPDIDVDFEHERREEVIQYIYRKYTRERAALAATVIRYRTKSSLRDVGAALGFGEPQIAALTRSLAWWDKRADLPERLAEIGLSLQSPRVVKWLALAEALREFPRHLSQHVGGFVISQGPLSRMVPIENASMAERSVIQWDKDDLESLGLLKVDVLALGMLTVIRRALNWVSARRGEHWDVHRVPPKDVPTYDMICKADTVGVFQIESRAQMSMLPRLRPREYYDLVVQVAIVRPGPIQGGMVHPYLKGHAEKRSVQSINPEIDAVLDRTFGVPIFQEQVMQLAIVAADFTPGQADQLRRAMASWKQKGHVEKFKDKLREGMRRRDVPEHFIEALCRQIEGFGEYGFPESHAASFALLAYVSSWIKCHEPEAFLCALLNSQPMGFYQPAQLVQDARNHGVRVDPVDVCISDWGCKLEWRSGEGRDVRPGVRLGLREISGFAQDAAERIAIARGERAFTSVEDLAARAQLSAGDMKRLAAANALESLSGHRRQAAWQVSGLHRQSTPVQADLFDAVPSREAAVQIVAPKEGENIVADYRTVGLTLGRHPLALLRNKLHARRFDRNADVLLGADRAPGRAAGIVTCRQKPGSAKSVFITIEDETGVINVIVHPWLVERQRREVLSAQLLGVFGQLQSENNVVLLVAKRLVDLTPWLGQLATTSRDFH